MFHVSSFEVTSFYVMISTSHQQPTEQAFPGSAHG
jgi:hypothetical protein